MEPRAVQSEQDVRAIGRRAVEAFFSLDSGWNFADINPAAERLLHRDKASLLGHNIWAEYPDAVGDTCFQQYHRAVAAQEEVKFEVFSSILNTRLEIVACPSPDRLSIYLRELPEEVENTTVPQLSQSVLDALTSHIAVLDDEGNIIAVNESWRRFAFENELPSVCSGVGANYLEVCDKAEGGWSDEAPIVAAAIRDIIAGRRDDFEIEYPCHSPVEQRWFRLRVTRFRDLEALRLVVDHLNITKRKLLELERDRFFALSLDLLCTVNEDGYFKRVNPAFERILGHSESVLLSRPSIDFVLPEDREITAKALRKLAAGEKLINFVNRLCCQDGSTRCIDWTSVTDEGTIYSVGRDITDSLHALEEQRKLTTLLEGTTDFLGWVTTAGIVEYLNPAARQMLAIPEDEVLEGRHIRSFLPEWACTILEREGLRAATLNGNWSGELVVRSGDGREIPVSVTVTAYPDTEGNILFFSIVARDISTHLVTDIGGTTDESLRRRTVELEISNKKLKGEAIERQMVMGQLHEVVSQLEGAKNEAIRAQKSAEQARHQADLAREEAERANHSKSEFLSRMSHELRTPLNAILGFGQLLQMEAGLPDKRRASVQHILKAGEHLLNLINEVLDISRIEVGSLSLSLEPILAQSAVDEVLDLMRPLAQPGNIELLNQIPTSSNWHVMADRQRLKQVLLNLVSNAVKYNRPNGRVTIYGEERDAGNTLRLCIGDTGTGLSPSDLGKLFTPFERLSASMTRIEGTGIGLVLSRRLTEAMGGKLGVDSELGVGSVFWIELPVAEDPKTSVQTQLEHADTTTAPVDAATCKYTILYIEDNLPNLELVKMILHSRADVRLLSATNGGAGLQLAAEHHPALILLDFHLPDMNGDEMLARLKGDLKTANIPVVIVSADATPGQIQRGLAAGAREYLTKPLQVKHFMEIVEKSLDG